MAAALEGPVQRRRGAAIGYRPLGEAASGTRQPSTHHPGAPTNGSQTPPCGISASPSATPSGMRCRAKRACSDALASPQAPRPLAPSAGRRGSGPQARWAEGHGAAPCSVAAQTETSPLRSAMSTFCRSRYLFQGGRSGGSGRSTAPWHLPWPSQEDGGGPDQPANRTSSASGRGRAGCLRARPAAGKLLRLVEGVRRCKNGGTTAPHAWRMGGDGAHNECQDQPQRHVPH